MTLKLLLMVVVLAAAAWLVLGRRRKPPEAPPPPPRQATPPAAPQAMVACAHCAVHLPEPEARRDAAGHAYCSDAHRLLGPR
jgi:uncharacterized protein